MSSTNEDIQDEAPTIPQIDVVVKYRAGNESFQVHQYLDGKQIGPSTRATAAEFLLFQILTELRALNASCEQERRIEELSTTNRKEK